MTSPMCTARLKMISAVLSGLMLFTLAAKVEGQAAGADKTLAQTPPATQGTQPRYKNAGVPIEERVADLLPRIQLEEKIDQIATGWENRIEVIDPTGTHTTEEARKVTLNEWGTEMKLTPR